VTTPVVVGWAVGGVVVEVGGVLFVVEDSWALATATKTIIILIVKSLVTYL